MKKGERPPGHWEKSHGTAARHSAWRSEGTQGSSWRDRPLTVLSEAQGFAPIVACEVWEVWPMTALADFLMLISDPARGVCT